VNRAAAVTALVLVAAAGGVTWRWLAEREPVPAPAPVVPEPRDEVPASGAVPEQAVGPPPAEPKQAPKAVPSVAGSVRYPDGSKQPALNGVQTDLVIQWGVRPFTPIVGVEDGPGGWKWYVHENGTRSTTAMVADKDGVLQAHAVVAEPETALPLGPGLDSPKPGGANPGTGTRAGGQK